MHSIQSRAVRIALAIAASLCLLAAPAMGDERPWERARWHILDVQIVSRSENIFSGQRRLESRLHKYERHEIDFSRIFTLNPGPISVFGAQGPFIAESAPGLAFELRF